MAVDQKTVLVWRGDGRIAVFAGDGAGNFTVRGDSQDRLTLAAGEYFLNDAATQSIERYDALGTLRGIAWKNGDSITMTYSGSASVDWPGAGYLTTVIDGFGRLVRFTYYPNGSVKNIRTSDGKLTGFDYDAVGNLAAVKWPDGHMKRYEYANAAYPWALTGVVDENDVNYATFTYDEAGRAASTEHAGGVGRFSVDYQLPPSVIVAVSYDSSLDRATRTHSWVPPAGATVSTPSASGVSITATAPDGRVFLSTQAQPAGSGCAASSRAQDFDQHGNLAWQNDFNGIRTCFSHDLSRNLRVSQVQGLSPTASCSPVLQAGAPLPVDVRKTSTAWHPDWNLEVKVARPRSITTNVYNGQVDPTTNAVVRCAPSGATLPDGKPIAVLCKRVEQATADANGSQGFAAQVDSSVPQRVWQWVFNDLGQVTMSTDPLNNVTTYAYYADTSPEHTRGDLQSVTTALNQVTRYTKYNPQGQVLQMLDANGVATDYGYDLRQRLTSVSVAGATSSYEYWPTGLLKRAVQPDGSFVAYEYDDAHRLTAVADAKGNRIEYTLDNAGNRTAEAVKDPAGNLARQLARVHDALGRVQQISGREQ